MLDQDRSHEQLLEELAALRRRVADLEGVERGRRQAEEELAKNKAILTAAIECLPFDFFALNPEGQCILQNAVSRRYYGNTIGKTADQVCPDKQALPQWLEGNRRALAGEKVEEENCLTVGGEQRTFYSVLAPIQDDHALYGVLGVNVDISKRKRAEAALQKAHDELEQRVQERTAELAKANENLDIFRKFAEDAGDGFGMAALDGRIAYVNPTLCRLFGEEKPEDAIGQSLFAYYPQEYVQRRQNDLLPALLREGHWHIEQTVLPRHGKPIQTLQSTFLIRDENGDPFRVAVVISDITERKEAEEKVRHNRELLQAIIDNTPALIYVKDLGGRVTIANRALCEAAGRDMQDVVGKSSRDVAIDSQNAEINIANDRRVIETGQAIVAEECSFGRIFLSVKFPLRDTQGRLFATGGVSTDITERKRAEEALRQSQATLDAFFSASTAILNICDEEFRYLKTDNLTPTYFGLDAQSIVGKSVRDLAPGFIQEFGPMIQAVADTGKPVHNVEVKGLVPNRPGETVYWRASYFAVPLPEGKRGHGVVGIEITDMKRVEEALRQSERRFRNYFEQGLIGMAVTSLDKRWLEVNDRLCEILGYPREELLERTWTALTHPDDQDPNFQLFDRLVAGQIEHFTLNKRYLKKDGGIAHTTIHVRAFRQEDGAIDHIVTLVEDITARKQAEDALRESEAKYRTLVETSPNAVMMLDLEGHITLASQRVVELYDAERVEDLLGRSPSEFFAPEDQQQFFAQLRRTLDEGLTRDVEYTFLLKDGVRRAGEGSAAVVRDIAGKPTGFVGIVRDITERKRAEDKLAYLASFPERNPNPVVEVRLGGGIQYINPAALRMFPELRDRGMAHPWLGNWDDMVRQLAEGRRENIVGSVTVAGRTYHQSFHYIAQDQVVRIYSLDITEQRQAQEAIKESEAKLRTLFRILPVGIAILDEHRRIVELNPALEQILGMSRDRLLKGDHTGRHYLHSDGSPMSPAEYPSTLAMQEGAAVANVEVGIVKEDGATVWTSVTAAPLPVRGLGAAVVTGDITQRKRAEVALQKQHRTLKHLLQSSDHERQIIAYEIHDGLAQQLAGAVMQFQTYAHLKDAKPGLAAKAFDAGTTILQQSHFEARRLIAGVRPPILDEAGVVAAVGHLVNEQGRLKGPNIEYRSRVTFDRLAPTLENAIYRITQEALANACQHSKSKKVRVSLVQQGDWVRITIRDWGTGFGLEGTLGHRFGLEGIRQRTRLLGGKCSIRSAAGKGTQVTVELPVVERDADE